MVWILFSVFSIFCITSSGDDDHMHPYHQENYLFLKIFPEECHERMYNLKVSLGKQSLLF